MEQEERIANTKIDRGAGPSSISPIPNPLFLAVKHSTPTLTMDWLWTTVQPYIRKEFERQGVTEPSDEQLHGAFVDLVADATVTILVQEPWRGSVRFKGLDRMAASDCFDLLHDPETYLFERFGGGKFKLNFHRGWNFVATRNFKPEGKPRWRELPGIDY